MACSRGCCASQREHWLSIGISAAATPSRRQETVKSEAMERQWSKDHPAYRRLVQQGLQPPSTVGAAELEARAQHPFEVESGRIYDSPADQASIKVGMELSRDLGLTK